MLPRRVVRPDPTWVDTRVDHAFSLYLHDQQRGDVRRLVLAHHLAPPPRRGRALAARRTRQSGYGPATELFCDHEHLGRRDHAASHRAAGRPVATSTCSPRSRGVAAHGPAPRTSRDTAGTVHRRLLGARKSTGEVTSRQPVPAEAGPLVVHADEYQPSAERVSDRVHVLDAVTLPDDARGHGDVVQLERGASNGLGLGVEELLPRAGYAVVGHPDSLSLPQPARRSCSG
jgi:hypothetical protein